MRNQLRYTSVSKYYSHSKDSYTYMEYCLSNFRTYMNNCSYLEPRSNRRSSKVSGQYWGKFNFNAIQSII